MYLTKEQRLLTYREFCNLLKDPKTLVWFDRLVYFYLDINQGKRMLIIEQIMNAVYCLSEFCDCAAQGNSSINVRLNAENKPVFRPHTAKGK